MEEKNAGTLVVSRKRINRDWTHLIDYYFLGTISWEIQVYDGVPDVEAEVGMGEFIGGEPRGERKHFRGKVSFTTLGPGAVYAKVIGPVLQDAYADLRRF